MIFGRKQPKTSSFPAERFEPVLRQSICTGERTACMRERETGKVFEIMLIRTEQDLAAFAKEYGVRLDEIRTVY